MKNKKEFHQLPRNESNQTLSPTAQKKDILKTEKDFKKEVKDFKKLKKRELVDIIFQLQEINLSLKKKIVEEERMLEERGDLILLLEKQIKTQLEVPKTHQLSNQEIKNILYEYHSENSFKNRIKRRLYKIFSKKNRRL